MSKSIAKVTAHIFAAILIFYFSLSGQKPTPVPSPSPELYKTAALAPTSTKTASTP